MILDRFKPSSRDNWHWSLAKIFDVPEIVIMAQQHFQSEITEIFTPDPERYAKHVTLACVEQSFNPQTTQLITARDNQTARLMAYAWLTRGHYMTYAPEECAEAAFVHMALDLPLRTRITLTAQILQQWDLWCQINGIPVLISTTIREDQRGFIDLHQSAGYKIRGSFAWKRLA